MSETDEATVGLSVLKDRPAGAEFVFTERTTCLVGRAGESRLRLPQDDAEAARHHCLLDIAPPRIRLRPLGGGGGTFVNGEEIGQGSAGIAPSAPVSGGPAERELVHGDELRIGETILRINVSPPAAPAPRRPPASRAAGGAGTPPGSAVRTLLRQADHDPLLTPLRPYALVREGDPGDPATDHLLRHRGTGDLASLRLLIPDPAVGTAARPAVLRAIEDGRALRHPAVVRLHAGGACGPLFWALTDPCRYGTLQDLLDARGGTLPVDQAVGVGLHLLEALAHAHDGTGAHDGDHTHAHTGNGPHGRVHGGITPSCIHLTRPLAMSGPGQDTTPGVAIGDFGLAAAFDRCGLSGATRTCGSPIGLDYVPRTRLTDHGRPGPEVDVWTTAAVLYRMLTGAPPRDLALAADPVLALLREPHVPVRHRAPAVPHRLARVIDAALIDGPRIVTVSAAGLRRAILGALR